MKMLCGERQVGGSSPLVDESGVEVSSKVAKLFLLERE